MDINERAGKAPRKAQWIQWNSGCDRVVPPHVRARVEAECARTIGLLDPADPNHIRKVQSAIERAWAWGHRLALEDVLVP